MNNRAARILAICLVTLTLIVSSCTSKEPTTTSTTTTPTTTPATTPTTKPTTTPTTIPTTTPTTKPTTPLSQAIGAQTKPKYGGTFSMAWPSDPTDFDQGYQSAWYAYTIDLTNETPAGANWAKGPCGTNEETLQIHTWPPERNLFGFVLESWEFPDPVTHIYHLRKGVRFQDKPPVNGREMVAKDLVVTMQRMYSLPTSWVYTVATKPISYEIINNYTVKVKFASFDVVNEYRIFSTFYVVPNEVVIDANGKETEALRNWKNSNGTGPFMLTDYVKGSSISFVKNPNYWQHDPFFKENQLPYVDKVKILIIPELTTRLVALRTGAIDYLMDIPWEQAESLTNLKAKSQEFVQRGPDIVYMRNDIKPFSDIKVRQALSMAIDRQALIKDLYNGHAEYLMDRFHPSDKEVFTPYEKLPQNVKDVYTYNPTKAKQLLAEAGYPSGFSTEILTYSKYEDQPVFMAAFWSKIGVQAKIDMREFASYNTTRASKKYAGMCMAVGSNAVTQQTPDNSTTGHYENISVVSDPWWDAKKIEASNSADEATRNKIWREMNLYALEQCWTISLPTPRFFVYWQDWLKNFEGGFMMGTYHYFRPFTYVWINK